MAKKKCLAALLCLLLLLGLAQPVVAMTADDGASVDDTSVDETDHLIRQIIAYEMDAAGVEDLQTLINTHFARRAGIDAEWYILALSEYDDTLDFSAYADSLENYLQNTSIASASSRQKYALALIACGRENTAFVRDTLNDSIGAQGIMSLVFGLHLLNNQLPSETYTVDSLVDAILSRQLSDGGFAVSGEHANADVTAMVLQSLAPYAKQQMAAAAIERALACLSLMQKENGAYESYGVPNAESCAQVLMALCALEVDPYTDARFIKNGQTLVDALQGFACSDGGYSHEAGGQAQVSSTAQTLCAYVALCRAQHGQNGFYIFHHVNYDPTLISDPGPQPDASSGNDRLWVSLGIGVAVLIACIVLAITRGKRGLRDALLIAALGALIVVLVMTVRVSTPEEYYNDDDRPTEAAIGTVTLSIRCDTVAGENEHIPENGIMLDACEVALYEKETVYDVLIRAAKQHRLLIETRGGTVSGGASRYIVSINNLGEFDFGELSGWVYMVNGIMPSSGCDHYDLEGGENIVMCYTKELGEDIKGEGVS